MVNEMIDGAYRQTNLANESAEYLARREELREAEIELMRQRERLTQLDRPGAQRRRPLRRSALRRGQPARSVVLVPRDDLTKRLDATQRQETAAAFRARLLTSVGGI